MKNQREKDYIAKAAISTGSSFISEFGISFFLLATPSKD
jgi:hypothetical protein